MARQSGGTARIESAPGKGTTVSLLFRKAEGQTVETATTGDEIAGSSLPLTPLSILVIDDDPDVRAFIVNSLEDRGYHVREASDGPEGLAALKRERADLIVLDFIMPGMSGAEVAREIRAGRPDQPILFVSGYSETEAVKRTAPDAMVLAKPFRADTLHKAVRSAIAVTD